MAHLPSALLAAALAAPAAAQQPDRAVVDATTVHGKVMCGYQGWFRCPGDAANMGWIHWSGDQTRIAPDTLTFDMWPDVSEYDLDSLFPAEGFTHPDGTQAYLFTSDSATVVLKHFEWMREYGLDGIWLQHFAVDLPGGPLPERYASRMSVLNHVREAAKATGRVWALSYDTAGMAPEDIVRVVTDDWKRIVDAGITADDRYLHEGGRPVVQVWGFYPGDAGNRITPEGGNALADFFAAPGPYSAYFVGGGAWNWRDNTDPAWQALYRRFNAYCPWNVGNCFLDRWGTNFANTDFWEGDQAACAESGVFWIPVIYPGFTWDNLKRQPPGTTNIRRRGGAFLWDQFHRLATLHVDTVYVAMFDEVDEGTAILKVTSTPPTQAHFVGYENLPSDWYLRLVGEGARMLRGERPISAEIPIKPWG